MEGKTRVCLHCGRLPEEHTGLPTYRGGGDLFLVPLCPTSVLRTVCPMCCRADCQCGRIFSTPGTIPGLPVVT